MPKLWDDTIEAHRREVGDAILSSTASLVAEGGLRALTMSQIAERAGIGRATLYKYFPDVEAILIAWHERQIEIHLEDLVKTRDQAGDGAGEQLQAVLEAYALILHEHRNHDPAAVLHRGEHVDRAHQQLVVFIRDLLREAAGAGAVRGDVPLDELATYCLNAVAAAGNLSSNAAVRRLVVVILAGLHPDA